MKKIFYETCRNALKTIIIENLENFKCVSVLKSIKFIKLCPNKRASANKFTKFITLA